MTCCKTRDPAHPEINVDHVDDSAITFIMTFLWRRNVRKFARAVLPPTLSLGVRGWRNVIGSGHSDSIGNMDGAVQAGFTGLAKYFL